MSKKIAITIKPTNNCNMCCRHCYHAEEGFGTTSLSLEHAKKMMLVATREYDEIRVVFHGGEPTLWGIENFKHILDYQKQLMKENAGLVFNNSIQTNGLLLDTDWFNLFKNFKFSVGISFDGPHNDDLRENTERIYKNMLKMKEFGLNFGVLCVESAISINNLRETYDWFNNEGFDFKILALFMSGNAKQHPEFELNIDEYVDSLVQMYEYWLFDKECRISMRTFEDLLKVSDKLYCIQYGGSCIYNRICLNPNGDLYPCGRPYTSDFILGNIETLDLISNAFKTIAYMRLVHISSERVKQCKSKCDYFGACKGGCVSSAILDGTFEKIDNITCVRAKRLLGAVTRINERVYRMYDEKINIDMLNPKALKIIEKTRTGQYEYTHFR